MKLRRSRNGLLFGSTFVIEASKGWPIVYRKKSHKLHKNMIKCRPNSHGSLSLS